MTSSFGYRLSPINEEIPIGEEIGAGKLRSHVLLVLYHNQ